MNRIMKNAAVCCMVGLLLNSCKKGIVEPQSAKILNQETVSQVIGNNEILQETITVPLTLEDGTQTQVNTIHFYKRSIPKGQGKIGVFVPGMAHSVNFFNPLMLDLLNKGVYTETFAMDMPGHGTSPIPAGVRFGDISLEQYQQTLFAYLLKKRTDGFNIVSVTGHSLGARVIEGLQSKLVKGNSGLKSMLGIEKVYLLSSAIPGDTRWGTADTSVTKPGSPKSIITTPGILITTDPMKGPFLRAPDNLFIGLFYANKSGVPAPGYAAALANRVDQSFKVVAEMIGLDPVTYKDVPRLKVGHNIFAQEELHVIYGEEDPLMQVGEQEEMAENLKPGTKTEIVYGTYSVHGVAFTDPTEVSKYY